MPAGPIGTRLPLDGTIHGRAIRERCPVHVPDVHFCRLMGGDLTVESVHGQGSTFTIRLPVAAPEESP